MTTRPSLATVRHQFVPWVKRQWAKLDRGWKSALLGLFIVGLHTTGVATW